MLNLQDVEEIDFTESRTTTSKFMAKIHSQDMNKNFQSRSEQHGTSWSENYRLTVVPLRFSFTFKFLSNPSLASST
jgi:hypothetical protein